MGRSIKNFTNSFVLVGGIALSLASLNTSSYMPMINPVSSIECKQECYNSSTTLREYSVPNQRFSVEEEANAIFGEMRPATIAEQKYIMEGIKSISTPVGINFWDLY